MEGLKEISRFCSDFESEVLRSSHYLFLVSKTHFILSVQHPLNKDLLNTIYPELTQWQ